MIELAQVYKKEGIGISGLSEKYNLPDSAFDGIVEALEISGYITRQDGQLSLQIAPDKISIWDIVKSIDKIHGTELTELTQDKQQSQTSTSIMVDKEIEVVLGMIRYRFKRHKLSAWSEKASKMIYI